LDCRLAAERDSKEPRIKTVNVIVAAQIIKAQITVEY